MRGGWSAESSTTRLDAGTTGQTRVAPTIVDTELMHALAQRRAAAQGVFLHA